MNDYLYHWQTLQGEYTHESVGVVRATSLKAAQNKASAAIRYPEESLVMPEVRTRVTEVIKITPETRKQLIQLGI